MEQFLNIKKKFGDDEVFRALSNWGDKFVLHEKQKKIKQEADLEEIKNKSTSHRGIAITNLEEKVDVEKLKVYAETLKEDDKRYLFDYINSLDVNGKYGSLKVNYIRYALVENDQIKYDRLFGNGICLQKLSREARTVATLKNFLENL